MIRVVMKVMMKVMMKDDESDDEGDDEGNDEREDEDDDVCGDVGCGEDGGMVKRYLEKLLEIQSILAYCNNSSKLCTFQENKKQDDGKQSRQFF